MKKKFFARSELQQMARSHKPRLSHSTDRLRHALIGHRILEIAGGCEKLFLGWWYRFDQFLDDVPPPWNQEVASLCVFQPDRDRRWSAAIAIHCTAFATFPKPDDDTDVESVLRRVDITYITVAAADVDQGYIKTPEFSSRIHRALLASAIVSPRAAHSSLTADQEGFTREPRPLYPPQSRFLRD